MFRRPMLAFLPGSGSSAEFSRRLSWLAVVFFVILCHRPVSTSFSIEFVKDKTIQGDAMGTIVLYECDSPPLNTPVHSPGPSPSPRSRLSDRSSRSRPRQGGIVPCKRVASEAERKTILSTNSFFLVQKPKLSAGEKLFDVDAGAEIQLPAIVNLGVKMDAPPSSYPEWKSGSVDEAKHLMAKLRSVRLLPYLCPDDLVNYFSVADIAYFTVDSPKVVKELAAFVAVLNNIVKLYYEDYYRTFLMYLFKYEIDMRLKERTRVKLVGGLHIVLPKMMDPCFVMSFQRSSAHLAHADKFCSSYCRVLVVAADIFKQKDKTCKKRWAEGKCRKGRCTCIKSFRGFSIFSSRVPMQRCSSNVVQTKIRSIFYSIGYRWFWVEGLLNWILLPKYLTEDMCSRMPDGTPIYNPTPKK